MNEWYYSKHCKVLVHQTEKKELDQRINVDNIEEILITENNIETLTKKLEKLNNEIKNLKSNKSESILSAIFAFAFGTIATTMYISNGFNLGIYYLIFSVLGYFFSGYGVKIYLENLKNLKITQKQYKFIDNSIKEENLKLKNLKANSKKQIKDIKKPITIEKGTVINELKNKLSIIKDYLLHKEEYQIYYNNGIIDWYLSNLYDKNSITFLKQLILEDLNEKEVNKQRNKTKIK